MNDTEYVASVVSIVPFELDEEKPGIYPGRFIVPASKNEEPVVCVVGKSIYHVQIDEDRIITIECPPHEIARAIVEDYITANLGFDAEGNASPGIFWEMGRYDSEDVRSKLSRQLLLAKQRQARWFKRLVELADDDWERTHQHRAIADVQRYACKALKLDRPWVVVTESNSGSITCAACTSIISGSAVICPHCRMIIDEERYEKMKFAEVR